MNFVIFIVKIKKMKKTDIKNMVREGLMDRLRKGLEEKAKPNTEKAPEPKAPSQKRDEDNDGKSSKTGGDEKNTVRDYSDVQNYFKKDLSFNQVDVMKKLGPEWEDDEKGVNRSLFGKMLHQDKNDKGGTYQFNDEQLDAVRSAIKTKI